MRGMKMNNLNENEVHNPLESGEVLFNGKTKQNIGIKPNTQDKQYQGIKMSTTHHINLATKSI